MGKLLLLGLAVIVAVWLLRRALAGPRAGQTPGAAPPGPGDGSGHGSNQLVSCAHCGLNLPKGEARTEGGPQVLRYYCSEEHLRAGPGKR